MRRLKTGIAAAVVGVAVLAGASLATAGTAAADSTASSPRWYPTYSECQTAGNKLAQQGEITQFVCVGASDGNGYFLHTSAT